MREQVSATIREVPPECISEIAIITNKLFKKMSSVRHEHEFEDALVTKMTRYPQEHDMSRLAI